MSPLDLIRARDGSMSQTKLAAACFHLLMFISVAWITYRKEEFVESMWLLYGSFALGHAVYDKTMANVKSFKDRKLEIDAGTAHEAQEVKPNP